MSLLLKGGSFSVKRRRCHATGWHVQRREYSHCTRTATHCKEIAVKGTTEKCMDGVYRSIRRLVDGTRTYGRWQVGGLAGTMHS